MEASVSHKAVPIGEVAIELVSRSQTIKEIVVASVFLSVAWLTVLLRFWTRLVVVKSLGWDDWCMSLTMVTPLSDLST
jgi:hypothetical protein